MIAAPPPDDVRKTKTNGVLLRESRFTMKLTKLAILSKNGQILGHKLVQDDLIDHLRMLLHKNDEKCAKINDFLISLEQHP